MARKSFKNWWQNFIPPAIERATYVLASSVVLALMCWWWQPIDIIVWEVKSPVGRGVLSGLFWLGWGILFLATVLISHFELFGVKQAFEALRQQKPWTVPSKRLCSIKSFATRFTWGFDLFLGHTRHDCRAPGIRPDQHALHRDWHASGRKDLVELFGENTATIKNRRHVAALSTAKGRFSRLISG